MKNISKYIFLIFIMLCISYNASSQVYSMDSVLHSIELNNRELRAFNQQATIDVLSEKIDNNLPDPSVTYSHQYGNRDALGYQGEFIVSQTFEFPTIYSKRSQLAHAKSDEAANQYNEVRRTILLRAKILCLDLVWLNQRKDLLNQRRIDSEKLSEMYAIRLQKGDANILETNKIALELLNVKTEERQNENDRQEKLKELAVLNGGIAIEFVDTLYAPVVELTSLESLRGEMLDSDAELKSLRSRQEYMNRQIGVRRAQGLPDFELGYRLNTATGGERFNGFLVGMSIPLFSNKNQVKKAKMQQLQSQLQVENGTLMLENKLSEQYIRAVSLKTSIEEYKNVLDNQQNMALLNKALEAGQISMIEYFVNITTLYQSIDNYLQLQNEYQKVMASLYKFRM